MATPTITETQTTTTTTTAAKKAKPIQRHAEGTEPVPPAPAFVGWVAGPSEAPPCPFSNKSILLNFILSDAKDLDASVNRELLPYAQHDMRDP